MICCHKQQQGQLHPCLHHLHRAAKISSGTEWLHKGWRSKHCWGKSGIKVLFSGQPKVILYSESAPRKLYLKYFICTTIEVIFAGSAFQTNFSASEIKPEFYPHTPSNYENSTEERTWNPLWNSPKHQQDNGGNWGKENALEANVLPQTTFSDTTDIFCPSHRGAAAVLCHLWMLWPCPGKVPVSTLFPGLAGCDYTAVTLLPPAQAAACEHQHAWVWPEHLTWFQVKIETSTPKKTTKKAERRLTPMWRQVHQLQDCKKTPSNFWSLTEPANKISDVPQTLLWPSDISWKCRVTVKTLQHLQLLGCHSMKPSQKLHWLFCQFWLLLMWWEASTDMGIISYWTQHSCSRHTRGTSTEHILM